MIIDKNILIKIDRRNVEYYKNINKNIQLRDVIKINVEELQRGSNKKIKVKCDKCGKEKMDKFYSYMNNYENDNIYLCASCSAKNKVHKIKKTNLEKYGVDCYTKTDEYKERVRLTNLEKYGVENVSQAKEIKVKKKETNLKNWGAENVFQSEEIKKISKKTKKEKYGDENFTNREKSKKTCMKNNGVEWPTQSDKVIEKRNLNNKKKWGLEHYSQTKEYQDRVKETCLKKYGKSSYLSTDECQEKSRKTCREKYGVDYPSQNLDIHKKQFPKMKKHEIGIKYQGSYEKDFLDLCKKLNLNVSRGKIIKFKYKNKDKVYFPDYYLEKFNLIVEIKSSYTYELHKELNLAKQKVVKNKGYDFIFIVDKKYDDFLSKI